MVLMLAAVHQNSSCDGRLRSSTRQSFEALGLLDLTAAAAAYPWLAVFAAGMKERKAVASDSLLLLPSSSSYICITGLDADYRTVILSPCRSHAYNYLGALKILRKKAVIFLNCRHNVVRI